MSGLIRVITVVVLAGAGLLSNDLLAGEIVCFAASVAVVLMRQPLLAGYEIEPDSASEGGYD